jgi:antitoxin VapB
MTATAKLFMHGRSQAVRLPKEFRLPGKEVRVSKVGDKVILEPIEKPKFDVDAWYARLDALGGAQLFVDGRLKTRRRFPIRAKSSTNDRPRRQGSARDDQDRENLHAWT